MMSTIITFALGFLAGGAACAISAKTLGWFNKQVQAAKVEIGKNV